MIEGDSRQQLELGVTAGLAQRVRDIRQLMMKAPTRPDDIAGASTEWVMLHPRFKKTLEQMLFGYETLLKSDPLVAALEKIAVTSKGYPNGSTEGEIARKVLREIGRGQET